jgi:hypothetical protein
MPRTPAFRYTVRQRATGTDMETGQPSAVWLTLGFAATLAKARQFAASRRARGAVVRIDHFGPTPSAASRGRWPRCAPHMTPFSHWSTRP